MVAIGDIEPDDLESIPTFRAAYSDRTALLMAKLAYRAYEDFHLDGPAFDKFRADFSRMGLEVCEGLVAPGSGTAGYVVASPQLIAVVFRGTDNFLDWQTNMRLRLVTLQGGAKVHTGFFQV